MENQVPIWSDQYEVWSMKGRYEENVLKDLGVSKEFFGYKFNKTHSIATTDGDKQNIIVRFRSLQFPYN